MRAALEHLRERAAGRRTVAVLGEMAELGEYAPEGHREVARSIVDAAPDLVIAVGPLARAYGGRWVPDREAALELLREELRPGDCVLLKGARVLELDRLADELVPVSA